MADLEEAKKHPARQFWDQLDDVHAGMLGVEGSSQHMQPMAPQAEPETNTIWFFTNKDSDLFNALSNGDAKAHFCVIGEDHDYYACVRGTLTENKSKEKVDKFWSSVVDAWFPEGKDDPSMTLLEMKLGEGAIWASTDSSMKFGWEIAKAKIQDEKPDIGVTNHITF